MDLLGHPFMGSAGGQGIVLVYFIKKCVSWQIVEWLLDSWRTHEGVGKVRRMFIFRTSKLHPCFWLITYSCCIDLNVTFSENWSYH